LAKVTSKVTFENTGKSGVRSYLLAIESILAQKISYVGAALKAGSEDERKMSVSKTTVANSKDVFYRVDLPYAIDAGKEMTIDVEMVFGHALLPFPSHITQADRQLVKFIGNVYFYSAYSTQTQTTAVNCASSSIDFYTKEKPVGSSDKTLTYGPYENIQPFKYVELMVHAENNNPFLTVTQMTRVIEVSHWGNIAVEETYDLVHTGAILKGPFSRYDYQRNQDGVSSVKSFRTLLPTSARDVYYRDEIGNISTSHLIETDDGIELELRPRFPLFGGWKTNYYIGYNIPSYQYLYTQGDQYALVMKFVDHVYDDQLIDQIKVQIILPEGARDVRVKTPYRVNREPDSVHYTYLDTVGRPVITMTKSNLVEQHIQDFEVRYTFPKYMLLQEPMLIIVSLFALFLLVIVYVRLDFSISKDEASESRMRVASLIEQTQLIHDRRSALYQSYEDAINKFKATKDSSSLTGNRKKIDANHKQLTGEMTALLSKLKAEGSDAADKLNELQKLDVLVRDQIMLSVQQAEKLVGGRLSKQQYLDAESIVRTKRDDLCAKMDAILASL
jgi:oligosaccharyltransferase complex subunit alpha (ribophorin I)